MDCERTASRGMTPTQCSRKLACIEARKCDSSIRLRLQCDCCDPSVPKLRSQVSWQSTFTVKLGVYPKACPREDLCTLKCPCTLTNPHAWEFTSVIVTPNRSSHHKPAVHYSVIAHTISHCTLSRSQRPPQWMITYATTRKASVMNDVANRINNFHH